MGFASDEIFPDLIYAHAALFLFFLVGLPSLLLMSPSTSPCPTSLLLLEREVTSAVIDQLFQQEMRGHLSEACSNSLLHGYPLVPGRPFVT